MAPQPRFLSRFVAVLGFAIALFGLTSPAWAQGNITGTVRNAANTNPVQFVTVQLLSISTGQQINSQQTNASGVYQFIGVGAGTYFIRTQNSQGFIDQIVGGSNNVAGVTPVFGTNRGNCVGCIVTSNNSVTSFTPGVGQVHGAAAQVYDFNLSQGGKISGTITKTAPLNGVNVQIFTSTGVQISGSAQTDVNGLFGAGFNPGPGLTPGDYYIKTQNVAGHIDAVFNTGQPNNTANCLGCTITSTGTLINVTGTNTTSGRNMTLVAGGTISGAVTGGGNPLSNGSVIVYNSSTGVQILSTPLNSGNYATSGLPAGTYKVATSNSAGFINQLHQGVSLTGFPQSSFFAANGTAVTVNVGAATTVNFSLIAGATISGTITNANGGATINGISVALFNDSNTFVSSQSSSGGGAFSFTGLQAGTYYLKTQNSTNVGTGFVDRAHNTGGSVTCGSSCNVTTVGTAIVVASGATASGRGISLLPGGRILGRVTIAGTATGIQGVNVQAYDSSSSFGSSLASATTNANGDYTIQGLATLSYNVKTSNSVGYLDKLYNDIPCTNCQTTAGQAIPVVAGGSDVTSINFGLVQGGTITGTITNASNSAGVQSVNVGFYNSLGQSVGSTNTNNSGVYISPGLPNGSYFVVTTNNQSGLINKLYTSGGGINCLSCQNSASTVVSGTPVPVTVGNQTTNINLALTPGLTIGGSVRRSDNNALVTSFSVQLYTAAGGNSSIGGQSTGQSGGTTGLFTLPAVPPGTYFVKTNGNSSSGLINQVWKPGSGVTGITCGNSCNPTELGTPIVLSSANVTDIDFVLAVGGSIAGTVTSTATGLPISGINMSAFDVNNPTQSISSINTDVNGNYTLGGLATANYYVRAQGTGNFIGEVFENVTCINCSVSSAGGTAIAVTAGAAATGKNFSLASGGTITGTVVNSNGNTPLQGISVQLSTATSSNAGSAQTNSSGVFTIAGLPAGTYYAKTSNSQGFIDEIYDNIVCQTCFSSSANGTPIGVTVNASQTANFALVLGRRVSGQVTDATTNAPISGIQVGLFNSQGQQITSATTNDAGNYTTQTGVPAGQYFAKTFTSGNNNSGYINKLYNNITCVNCLASSGNAITIGDTDVTGINFSLSTGGRVTGTVTDSSNAPVAGVSVSLYSSQTDPLTKQTIFLGSGMTGPTGTFAVNGLPAGTAVAKTTNGLGYIDEIYNDVKCANCSVTNGQTFTVAVGQTTTGINFQLDSGARITGTIKNSSNIPLQGVSIGVYTAASPNTAVATASTNQLGVYTTGGLQPGTYFVKTTFANGYVNQLFNGIPCAPCSAPSGTAIALANSSSVATADFTLATGASIAGTVLEGAAATNSEGTSAVGSPISGARVSIYDSGNTFVASTTVLGDGTYRVTGLAAGTYFAKTSNDRGFIDKMYNGVNCVFCSLTGGTPINVPATGEVGNINFALVAGGSIAGSVKDGGGLPLANISVSLIGAGGQFLRSTPTDGLGNFTLGGLADGTYYLKTQNSLGYIDKLYNDITCSTCNPLTGTGVKVLNSSHTTGILFSLPVGGFITGTITNGVGTPIDNVSVSVFAASGGPPVATGFTNANGVYKTGGVPSGSYFVKTNNSKGYVDQLYLGKVCTICNPTTGTAVPVTVGMGTSGIDFAMTLGGRITGTITSAADNSPLPGVNVMFFNASGNQVGNAQTNGTGTYVTFAGLPTGTYYARTNNSQGLVDEIYDNVVCPGCSPATGKPISVTVGLDTTGVDFSMAGGARIGGTITDSSNSSPIANARVDIFTSNGFFITSAQTGSNGKYVTNAGLSAGTYYARANSTQGHIAKMYNNVDCPVCSPLKGTPIPLSASQQVSNIDFSLAPGGLISGTVKDQVTGAPIGAGEGTFVSVQIFNASNNLVAVAGVDPAGRFTSGSGMPTGTYYARTINNQGYINKLYGNFVCLGESRPGGAGGGLGAPACVPASGTGIGVTSGQTTQNINFTLAIGLRIGGKITDAATNQPLQGAGVTIFDAQGRQVTGGRTDNAGNYQSDGGLPPGTYYAIGSAFDQGYVPELYNNVACLACNPILGEAINASSSQTGINFALTTGGSFSGSVKAAAGGAGLPNVKLSLYSQSGSLLGSGKTDGSGQFAASGIPPGTYFIRTFNLLGLVDESYLNNACAPCVITSATQINVTAGGAVTGLDFLLDQGGLVSGTVTDGTTNAPLQGATVSFYTQAGAFVGRSEPSDENGYYAISLPVGTYTVLADPLQGYTPVANNSSSRGTNAGGTVTVTPGSQSTVEFPLEVCTPPAITPTSFNLLSIGTAYSQTLTATGSNGPYTFSLADGSLPPGLTLSSAGVLSGTPTTRGTANFTIAATGGNSCSGTNVYAQTTRGISLSSLEASYPAAGGTGTIDITAESSDVVWTASTAASWITITSGASGTGNGSVGYLVAANTGAARTGFISIGGEAFLVTQVQPSRPRIAMDTPRTSDVLGRSFQVAGWAIDLDATSGVGTDSVLVYAAPLANGVAGTPLLLGEATRFARADLTSVFGSQFVNSGYYLGVSGLPVGTHRIIVQARSTITGRYDAEQTADVTVTAPEATPYAALDSPAPNATVGASFNVEGWAVDIGATTGTGVDAVHVWAFRLNGGSLGPGVFLGAAALGYTRADIAGILGNQFGPSGYLLTASGLSAGTWRIAAYPHSSVTGTFSAPRFSDVTVDVPIPRPVMAVDGPQPGATVGTSFVVVGWAADLGAQSGPGVSALHVWAFNTETGAATFLGTPSYGSSRADVGAIFGPAFTNSGFSLSVPELGAGVYDIVIFAQSTVTGTFNQSKTVRITVP